MKKLTNILTLLGMTLLITFSMSSCIVLEEVDHDHGNHKGWYMNSHNPHHPHSNNPGHGKQKHHGHH